MRLLMAQIFSKSDAISSWWVGGAAEVVVSSRCGDHDAVGCVEEAGVDEGDLPARHLSGVVGAFAGASAVAVAGGSAFAVAANVINMPDGRVTAWGCDRSGRGV